MFWNRRPKPAAPTPVDTEPSAQAFLTHEVVGPRRAETVRQGLSKLLEGAAPKPMVGVAQDEISGFKTIRHLGYSPVNDVLTTWFGSQTFIGFQMAAVIAQHWLVLKACVMPARDAVRRGYSIALEGPSTTDIDVALKKANKRYCLTKHMRDFVARGRVFGIRIVVFKVETDDEVGYYEAPYNPDGVLPGAYRGMVQVDPYWCSPELSAAGISDPSSPDFYEPTWWRINGRRYHKSHLCIFRTDEVADMLKPAYLYAGVSIPQKIMERVYAAERTANEGPQLAATKRMIVWNTELAELITNPEKAALHMANFTEYANNYGVKVNDIGDTMQQFDTTLSDVDSVIMTQYQLVAAAANVPATKLLGTTPKGFNSTGEYEEANYHEELETVQENDLLPLAERHLEMTLRSDIEPQFNLAPGSLHAELTFAPLDSPTAVEVADINFKRAQADTAWSTIGAVDAQDVRDRLRGDDDSGYAGLGPGTPLDELDEATKALEDFALTGGGPVDPLEAATAALEGGA